MCENKEYYRTSGRGWNSLKLSMYIRNWNTQVERESTPSWCYGRVSKGRMPQREASMLRKFKQETSN